MKLRSGQLEFMRGVQRHRIAGLLARRQFGKTTLAGQIALLKMMQTKGHTVIFGSVKVDLGREIVRKEADAMQKAFALIAEQAKAQKGLLSVADADKDKVLHGLTADDFAELYEASRLEFRYYHSKTVYSRTKVVALTPAAVGETGDLILDEVGRVRNFRDVYEAVSPIIASNPNFRCIFTTTPPPDDSHYSFDLLAPPIGADLPVNPLGNWYQSELGVHVLRITAYDAYADGVPLYDDDTGKPISPQEAFAAAHDKDAWRRNYGCEFTIGGTAACNLLCLDTAQRRGIDQCKFFNIQNEEDFSAALDWLYTYITSGKIGLGWDLATTTKETSNPSGFTVTEEIGPSDEIVRAILIWKLSDPDIALARARQIITTLNARKSGGRCRRLCVDATNEKYFSQRVKKELGSMVPVELVVGSESIQVPGTEDPINMKQHLGSLLCAALDDNKLTLPAERYVREDWRMVKKEKGQFVCNPDADGRHGDTFDSTKLAHWALRSNAGGLTTVEGIHVGNNTGVRGTARVFTPRLLKPFHNFTAVCLAAMKRLAGMSQGWRRCVRRPLLTRELARVAVANPGTSTIQPANRSTGVQPRLDVRHQDRVWQVLEKRTKTLQELLGVRSYQKNIAASVKWFSVRFRGGLKSRLIIVSAPVKEVACQ